MDVADLVPARPCRRDPGSLTKRGSFLRRPLLHFLAIGAVLAALRSALPAADDDSRLVVVTPAVVERLAAGAGAPPGGRIPASAVERWLDEEVLYREGLRRGLAWNPASIGRLLQVGRFVGEHDDDSDREVLGDVKDLGLDRDDPVVRAQVVARMRIVLADEAGKPDPGDGELERFLATHAERFARPAVATFSHVFVRRERGREAVERIAASIRHGAAREGREHRLGDVFDPGPTFRGVTRVRIEATFGGDVARAVMELPEGEWSGPVRSAYGWHLLKINARVPGAPAAMGEVRDRVLQEWREERVEAVVSARIRSLREAYRIAMVDGVEARIRREAGPLGGEEG